MLLKKSVYAIWIRILKLSLELRFSCSYCRQPNGFDTKRIYDVCLKKAIETFKLKHSQRINLSVVLSSLKTVDFVRKKLSCDCETFTLWSRLAKVYGLAGEQQKDESRSEGARRCEKTSWFCCFPSGRMTELKCVNIAPHNRSIRKRFSILSVFLNLYFVPH